MTSKAPATLRRSLAWVGVGQLGYIVLTFLGSVAVARLLTPYDTGVFAIAASTVGLLAIIQGLGLNNFLVREATLTPELIATTFTVNAMIAALLSGLVALLAIAGGAFFQDKGVRNVLLVLAVVPIIGQLAFLPNAMLERDGEFRTLALLKTGSTAIGLILTISLALAGFSYMSLAYSQVATALLTNLTLLVVARRHVSFRLSLSHWSTVSRFGAQIFAVAGISRMAQRMSDIALGRLVSLPALGLYSRAASNYNILWDNIHTIAARVLLVDFSALRRDGVPLRERYLQTITLLTALIWPALLGAAILAGPLVRIVYGAKWDGAATPLSFLCLAGVLLASVTMAWEVFIVMGETGRQARLELVRTIIGLSLFVAGCLHSLEAAALARVGDGLVAQLIYRRHLCRMTGATPAELHRIYMRSAAMTVPAVLPALIVMGLWRWSPGVPAWIVALAIIAGGAGWLLALRQAKHPLWIEAMRLLGRFRRGKRAA